jgi:hypothetical protein
MKRNFTLEFLAFWSSKISAEKSLSGASHSRAPSLSWVSMCKTKRRKEMGRREEEKRRDEKRRVQVL